MNKILICDDEEGIRESLKLILEKHYELVFASNAFECFEVLKSNKDIKLLFLDIKMPKVSGLDVLRVIKNAAPSLKVFIVSGYNSVETATYASRLGADDYIVKPFESKDILEKVGNVV